MPENADRKIAAFQILDILGYNPSYIESCELTEGIGLKLNRARFRVTLLAAIPAVNSTPAQPAESRVPQTLNKLTTPKEYQPVNYWLQSQKNDLASQSVRRWHFIRPVHSA